MRICYASDIHGAEAHYDRLGELLSEHTPELLILGGDLFPDGDEADPPASQAAYVHGAFAARVAAWKAAHAGLEVACIVGNHDWLTTQQALRELHDASKLVLLTPESPWSRNGIHFLGYSCTPPTPFWLKDFERLDRAGDEIEPGTGRVWDEAAGAMREVDHDDYFRAQSTLADDLEKLTAPAAPWIFVCHAPPWNTKLDRLPKIDHPVGSHAVRDFITRHRPLVALHGHIHESPRLTGAYHDEIDGVTCINAGQADDELHAVVFDTDDPAGTLRHTVYS